MTTTGGSSSRGRHVAPPTVSGTRQPSYDASPFLSSRHMFHSWRVERKTIAQTIEPTRLSLSSEGGRLRIVSSRCAWMLDMCFVFASRTRSRACMI